MKTFYCSAVLVLLCAVDLLAQVTIINAGRLVDPETATVLTDQTIIIRDNKIDAVGKGIVVLRTRPSSIYRR